MSLPTLARPPDWPSDPYQASGWASRLLTSLWIYIPTLPDLQEGLPTFTGTSSGPLQPFQTSESVS